MTPSSGNAIDPQQLQQALAQLHDIAEPAAPGWWPLAPGWWALLAAVVSVLLLAWLACHWWRKTALRRAAAKHLAALREAANEHSDRDFLIALAELLRRASRQRYPQSAGLTGEAWAAHLNHAGETNFFTTPAGQQLLESRFSGSVNVDRDVHLSAVNAWLARAL